MLQNPKGSPLSVFWHCETFFKKNHQRVPSIFDDLRNNALKVSKRPPWRANSFKLLGFSCAVEVNTLTLRSPFAIFESYRWCRSQLVCN